MNPPIPEGQRQWHKYVVLVHMHLEQKREGRAERLGRAADKALARAVRLGWYQALDYVNRAGSCKS